MASRRLDRGFSAEVLTPEEVWEIEPAISKSIVGGVRFPHDAQVRNPKLVQALAKGAAFVRDGISCFGNPVTTFLRDGERVVGVEVNGERIYGDTIVIASGCWSGSDRCPTRRAALPMEPARGQMVLAEADASNPAARY